MSFKSEPLYFKIYGDYAIFTHVSSKGGGEHFSYSVPTKQGLQGIVDNLYFKPTFNNVIDEVKVINQIETETKSVLAKVGKNKKDLNYVTYISDPIYLVKYHFEWNVHRGDLSYDRNEKKHYAIAKRSIDKGGRRDVFLGKRECVAYVEGITEDEYNNATSFYKGQKLSFGIMFNSFTYPIESGEPLIANFAETIMDNGVIKFKKEDECEIKNTLSNYNFKVPKLIKSADEELEDLNNE